jgi:uncharacterized protein
MRPIFLILLLFSVGMYVTFGLYLYFAQKKYIYFPDSNADFYDCPLFHDSQKVEFQGTRFYYKQNSARLLVHYHGNADTACNSHAIKEILDELEYSYIFVEYAGYAGGNQEPSKELILKDVRNVSEYLKKISFSELTLMGESLGTGVASYHASLSKADKVLLVSPFDRLRSIAQKQYPIFPVKLLLTEEYDNVEWLKNQKGRLLIIHGAKENVVSMEFGRRLYENAGFSQKEFVPIEGAGHNDIYFFEKTIHTIKEFL